MGHRPCPQTAHHGSQAMSSNSAPWVTGHVLNQHTMGHRPCPQTVHHGSQALLTRHTWGHRPRPETILSNKICNTPEYTNHVLKQHSTTDATHMSTSLVLKEHSTTDATHMSTSLVLKQHSTTEAKHLSTIKPCPETTLNSKCGHDPIQKAKCCPKPTDAGE